MTSGQLEDVYIIETECFSHPWSKQSLEEELNNETSLFLVAKEENEVIGYIGMSIVIDEGYIFNVAARERYRNKGVANALINEIVTYGTTTTFSFITVEVRESNLPAISLYSKFGFIKAGERKDYYSNPKENAILLTKYL